MAPVDRQWSLTPFIYAWHFALHSNPALLSGQFSNPRTVLIAILATLWGLRLTFNFWRKGGYSGGLLRGEEDYRWVVMKKVGFKWSMGCDLVVGENGF